jgi:HSP20 family protein
MACKDPDDSVYLVSERPSGTYSRQLVLGEGLAVDAIRADYQDSVLTLTILVAEQAKPRKIEITRGSAKSSSTGSVGSHEGHKMISGQSTTDRSTDSQLPVTTGAASS